MRAAYPELIEAMLRAARQGWQRGLVAGSGGNISCRCGDGLLITRSGSSFRTLAVEDILLLSPEGQVLRGRPGARPSIEAGFHRAIYQARPEVQAVYHTHSPYASLFACQGRAIPLVSSPGKMLLGHIPAVAYAEPGSRELVQAIEEALAEYPGSQVLTLLGHGLTALGTALDQAYDMAELAEAEAELAWKLDK